MVATWIISEGEFIDVDGERLRISEHAAYLAKEQRLNTLKQFVSRIIQSARPNGIMSAAWEVGQELAPNDYDRIEWPEVAKQLRIE
jgi:hypothetical protein